MQPLHIAVAGALFDYKAEGVCTGRLVRALLEAGAKVTLVTAEPRAKDLQHPNFQVQCFNKYPRDPKWLFRAWARLTDGLDCNLYLWSRRAGKCDFEDKPDLVYARAWPDSSLMAGYRLAEAHDLPLWLHFSDPFPPPADPPLSAGRRADLQRVADRAQRCTFTNAKTLAYQRGHLKFPSEAWGLVVPHVSPEPADIGPRPGKDRLLYVGTFSRKRDPRLMLQGFALMSAQRPQARFRFVGPKSNMLQARVRELGLEAKVDYAPYADNNRDVMREADVLVGLDNLDEDPMYSLTKVAEYLTVNRPVLHLVSPGSPDRTLMEQFPESSAAITPDSPEAIAAAMARMLDVPDQAPVFAPRFAKMREYGGAAIANNLIAEMQKGLGPHE